MQASTNPWNSLEVAKLIASLLTPVLVALVGIYIHRVTKRFEQMQWRSQKLVEKRLSIYDVLAPDLNDLLCYFTYVGRWRDVDPGYMVNLKRSLDKKVYLAAPLFSAEVFRAYMAFQSLCFKTYEGWAKDPLLRTQFGQRREARADWKSEWDGLFSKKEDVSDPKDIGRAYRKVMESLASDIGVNQSFVLPPNGKIPGNIR